MTRKYKARLAINQLTPNMTTDGSKLPDSEDNGLFRVTSIRISLYLFVPLICCLPWAILNSTTHLVESLDFYYFVTLMIPLEAWFFV